MIKFTKEMKKKANNVEKIKNSVPKENGVSNGVVQNEQPVAKTTNENGVANLAKSVDNSIFQYFKDLTHEEEKTRQQAAVQLLLHLAKSPQTEKQQKEICYTLKRLVRGCGAATNASRAGFYTALVALLKSFTEESVPLTQVFETMQKELLVGKNIQNKEDADAIVGKILVCGAIVYSGRAVEAKFEDLVEVTKLLIEATQHRTYHASLSFSLLVELVQVLPQAKFEKSVWPLLLPVLTMPWAQQTLHTMHCLLALQNKFPQVLNEKFYKKHFSQTQLINADSYEHLFKIFWQNNNIDILMHPAFELFGLQLATSAALKEFWTQIVDAQLKTPTKLVEVITVKIATDILNHLTADKAQTVVDILSDNFVQMLVAGLKRSKVKKDEALRAFYNEFLDNLVEYCSKNVGDKYLVAVIKRLVLPPGIFSIEKYTQTRILHQIIAKLSATGVQELYELYKHRFVQQSAAAATKAANNAERVQAGYMLQHLLAHKSVQQAHEWRMQQLCFLWNAGIYHLNEDLKICKQEKAGNFSKEFGEQCKNIFYASMQTKIHALAQEQQLLLQIVTHVQQQMQKFKWNKEYLRVNLQNAETLQAAWQRMFDKVSEKQAAEKGKTVELQQVFDILLLHMGLQLFCEPEMSVPAIDDLLKCLERTKQQMKSKKKAEENNAEEPEWIEVIIDLLLHLLSQNSSTLRNIVNALFPHLCGSLSLNAVHQILSVLEMKDGYNPLSAKGEQDDDDYDDEEDEEEEAEAEAEESVDDEEEEAPDNDDEKDEEDDDEEEEDEEVSPSDILRNAVSQALMQNGALPDAQKDDDMESIDLNDLTEEEGQRLDEALAAAFKIMKRSGTGNAAKKSKSYRLQTTTLMHFRIRVLDLLEIYLQHAQPQLLIVIEIMLCVFNMLEYCVGDDLLQLRNKAEKLLQKLSALKNCQVDADLQQSNLVAFMRLLVEKRVPAAAFDLINRVRNKCILFLFNQVDSVAKTGANDLFSTWQEYAEDYVKSRNPTVNITLWSELVNKLRWEKVCTLIDLLVQQGIDASTRIFRRIQIFEILSLFYKNQDLQRLHAQTCKKTMKNIEKRVLQHLQHLAESTSIKHSPKEFQTLLELLLIIKRTAQRLSVETKIQTEQIGKWVQQLRSYMRLESMQVYQQFCHAFKLNVIKNSAITIKPTVTENKQNAKVAHDNENEEEEEEHAVEKTAADIKINGINDKIVKNRKRKQEVDVRKQKKQKKLLRLETVSKGLSNGSFDFALNGKHIKNMNGISDDT